MVSPRGSFVPQPRRVGQLHVPQLPARRRAHRRPHPLRPWTRRRSPRQEGRGEGMSPRADAKVGELRPSQLLFSFGVGATVDLPNISAMVMGLDDWDTANSARISEERLLAAVRAQVGGQVERLLSPPLPPEAEGFANPFDPSSARASASPSHPSRAGCSARTAGSSRRSSPIFSRSSRIPSGPTARRTSTRTAASPESRRWRFPPASFSPASAATSTIFRGSASSTGARPTASPC